MAPDTDPAALLAGWREAERAATDGPWEVHRSTVTGIRLASDEEDWPLAVGFRRDADAEFTALARTAMPLLLAVVEAAFKAADDVEQVPALHGYECAGRFRETITAALTGTQLEER